MDARAIAMTKPVPAFPEIAVAPRPMARVVRPEAARHGDAFIALRLGSLAFGREGDPIINLDHFQMGGPTFPPHAHAGFSAITYMLPESSGGMRNRDSLGDTSLIPPGGLHWTAAGSGIVHEEVPDRGGETVEGFQIFIRQPVSQETAAPAIHHVEPHHVPMVPLGRGHARVLAGQFGGLSAPFPSPSPLALLDLTLAAGDPFSWSPEPGITTCTLYLFVGSLTVGDAHITAPALILFARGEAAINVAARDCARCLLLAGAPLDAPSVSNGPFVLSSQAALDDAVHRYRNGAMGRLT
jgi:redox-sensitive bicupin YhaK (pirin superfamily)